MAGTMLVERHRTPELLEAFRARVIRPVMISARASLERGQDRGEVRADADLDVALEALAGQSTRAYSADTRSTRAGSIALSPPCSMASPS
jgi:hypothetical protein